MFCHSKRFNKRFLFRTVTSNYTICYHTTFSALVGYIFHVLRMIHALIDVFKRQNEKKKCNKVFESSCTKRGMLCHILFTLIYLTSHRKVYCIHKIYWLLNEQFSLENTIPRSWTSWLSAWRSIFKTGTLIFDIRVAFDRSPIKAVPSPHQIFIFSRLSFNITEAKEKEKNPSIVNLMIPNEF
jgi:hypothetical protein